MRPPAPTLETIEGDLADVSEVLDNVVDLARLWGDLDDDAALALIAAMIGPLKRIKRRATERRELFKQQYHENAAGRNPAAVTKKD